MRWRHQRGVACAVLAPLVMLCACAPPAPTGGAEPEHAPQKSEKDQVVRPNKLTGEVSVVVGNKLEPVTPLGTAPTSSLAPSAARKARATTAAHQGGPAPATPTAAPQVTASRSASAAALLKPLRFLRADGKWYEVPFEDPRRRRRTGFVEGPSFRFDADPLTPTDLSIRDVNPGSLEPVDISIRDPR